MSLDGDDANILNVDTAIANIADLSPPTPTAAAAAAAAPRKRGRPQVVPLDDLKDEIVRLFADEDIPIIDIARRLNTEHGLDISERTISRRLTAWNVPRKKQRVPASQEVCDRIVAHYNANLSDEQICAALATEGIDMKVKNLSRLRQKLGMRRRSRFPEFREFEEEQREGSSYTYSPTQERERERERERATGADLAPAESPSRKKRKSHAAAAPTSPGLGLIPQVTVFVEKYMAKYDGSHDFHHVRRVVGLAHVIYNETRQEIGYDDENTQLDLQVITLAALLHDVGDRKYLEPGQDASTLVLATLLGFGASEDLAIKVQRIVSGVSYTSELADPVQTQTLILRYPELAIVQDADRLDAIGAVGIGRVFTYGGAKTQRAMDDSIAHFADKLEKLEGMMKTKAGLRLARQRTEKLEIFKRWWVEELQEAEGILRKKT